MKLLDEKRGNGSTNKSLNDSVNVNGDFPVLTNPSGMRVCFIAEFIICLRLLSDIEQRQNRFEADLRLNRSVIFSKCVDRNNL